MAVLYCGGLLAVVQRLGGCRRTGFVWGLCPIGKALVEALERSVEMGGSNPTDSGTLSRCGGSYC